MALIQKNSFRFLKKPEYFYRPRQIFSRLRSFFRPKTRAEVTVKILNQKMSVSSRETIGKSLIDFGVYDLALTETIWRLVSSGAKVADIGANMGYFSLVLAHRVGAYGTVHCFEPHPQLQKKWRTHLRKSDQCKFYPVALSNKSGELDLYIPQNFDKNEGIASLEKTTGAITIKVPVRTLDEILSGKKVELIKIDVEGHELCVLQGGLETLKDVEHVLFEDFQGSRSLVAAFLKEQGFSIFRIYKGLTKVQLLDAKEADSLPLWEPPNFIATRNEQDVREKLSMPGWKCLKIL